MSTTIVSQPAEQEQHHPFLPLKTERMTRDEVAALRMELEYVERLTRLEAESRAARLQRELREYADDWDAWAYRFGNEAGLPF